MFYHLTLLANISNPSKDNHSQPDEKGYKDKAGLKLQVVPARGLFAGSFFKGLDTIGKQLGAGGAISMVGFGVDMRGGASMNML